MDESNGQSFKSLYRHLKCLVHILRWSVTFQVQGALEELKTRRQMEAEDDETEVYVIPANTWRAQVQFVVCRANVEIFC